MAARTSPHSLWNDEDLLRTIGSVANLERKCNHTRSMPVRTVFESLCKDTKVLSMACCSPWGSSPVQRSVDCRGRGEDDTSAGLGTEWRRQKALCVPALQPSCWHRLPPPCATQYPELPSADVRQSSCWHRLPPPCALQYSVLPCADFRQSSCWHRFPPPCALQYSVLSIADFRQSSCWHRFPPPCALQYGVLLAAHVRQPSRWHRFRLPLLLLLALALALEGCCCCCASMCTYTPCTTTAMQQCSVLLQLGAPS